MNSTPKKKMKQQLLPATLTALKILQILEEFSDQDHPVAQTAIAEELDIDRKTVARCLEVMEGHMDYDIVHQRKGVYLVPDEDSFELSEIRLLIDSVLSSKGISADQTDVIVKKLSKLLNKHDRTHIRHIHSYKDWSKIDNQNVFWSIEVLDDAINKNVKVSFDYSTIGIDKKLHVIDKYTVSPVQLVFSNGQYFLLAFVDEEEEMRSFRIDRITNAKALSLVAKNKKKGCRLARYCIYLCRGSPVYVVRRNREDKASYIRRRNRTSIRCFWHSCSYFRM
jgi:predicted DNA-binding transcriptional regulator YafY